MKLTISSGNRSRCNIDTRGAHVSSLFLQEKEILKPAADGIATHGGAAALIPYANRVRDATYIFEGKRYSLPKNDGNNSIHGLTMDVEWNPIQASDSSMLLHTEIKNRGLPSSVRCDMTFEIGESWLSCKFRIKNVGTKNTPFVIGSHPYFCFKGEWKIVSNSGIEMLRYVDGHFPDGTLIPVGDCIVPTDGTAYDNCFRSDGLIQLNLGYGLVEIDRSNMPYFVVYNGKYSESKSVAVEPMTGAPDAFNNSMGLERLRPDQTFECGYTIRLHDLDQSR